MRLEEMEKWSRRDLRDRINQCFEHAQEVEANDRPAILTEAEFYMRELEHRADSRVSIRDLILEIVVIALIGWEIHMGYRQEWQQNQAFDKEQTIWTNMERSSNSTANTLGAVENTMQMTSSTLQRELALFYDVALNVVIDQYNDETIDVVNTGRTNVTFWGIKIGNEHPTIRTESSVIPPGAGIRLDWIRIYDVMAKQFPEPTEGSVQFEAYIKNAKGEEFVQHGDFVMHWANNTGTVTSETTRIEPERWSAIKIK